MARWLCVVVWLVSSLSLRAQEMRRYNPGEEVPGEVVRRCGAAAFFELTSLPDSIFRLMLGRSFPKGCGVKRGDLCYLKCLHVDESGSSFVGEMVVNRRIGEEVLDILRSLYESHYPIERMLLIDRFGADDARSMAANNTSAFCWRFTTGGGRLSRHAFGMAVDINPLYNPYVRRLKNGSLKVAPESGRAYANRTKVFPYKIEKGNLCQRLFKEKGFRWGGAWSSCKDWQHFEK